LNVNLDARTQYIGHPLFAQAGAPLRQRCAAQVNPFCREFPEPGASFAQANSIASAIGEARLQARV
jgi:hypothetical protein